jgi:hypothetical protein
MPILIFVYVDDLLIASPRHLGKEKDRIKRQITEKYDVRDLGDAKHFLNIRITRDRDQKTLHLCQDTYIEKLFARFHLEGSKLPKTPLSTRDLVPYEGIATREQIQAYQQRIGSINYPAVVSRPDIAYAASLLAQFNQNPSPEHVREADRVILYLYATREMGIRYSESDSITNDSDFEAFSDASFADDISTRRSTQGYLITLLGGPIAWQSTKQRSVVRSTTEAELLSLSSASTEIMAMSRLFGQIRMDPQTGNRVNCDNKQTVGLINKSTPQLSTKLRHVDIHHFWLRQEAQNGNITVQWVPTGDMTADGLTKALPIALHQQFLTQLPLRSLYKHET